MESALGLWLVGVPSRVGYNTDARRLFLKEAVSGHEALAGLHAVIYLLGLLKALGGVATFTPPTLCLEPEEEAMGAQVLSEADLPGQGPWVGVARRGLRPGQTLAAGALRRPGPGTAGESGPAWCCWGETKNDRWPMRSGSNFRGRWWIWWGGPACGRPWGCVPTQPSGHQRLGVDACRRGALGPPGGPVRLHRPRGHRPLHVPGHGDSPSPAVQPLLQADLRGGYPCLTAISVDEVTAAARSWLKEGAWVNPRCSWTGTAPSTRRWAISIT